MSWTTSISDLRTRLSDGSQDRFHYRKRCFGETNGANKSFKSFEFRRVTDFVVTQGVYKSGVLQAIAAVASDDLVSGVFNLVTAPVDGDIIEASYYTQWFLDVELSLFVVDGMRWLLSSSDPITCPEGLIPCVLDFACSEAYMKMAQRWREFISDVFKVEDVPHEEGEAKATEFTDMAEKYLGLAEKKAEMFYTRQKRNLQPLFSSIRGRVRQMP